MHIVLIVAAGLAATSAILLGEEGGSEFRDGRWQEVAPPAPPPAPEPEPVAPPQPEPAAEPAEPPVVKPVMEPAIDEGALVQRYVAEGKYRAAIKAAKQYLALYDDPRGRQEVMMLAAEAERRRKRLFQAYEWYERLLAEFPDGRYSEEALEHEFAIAEAFLAGEKRVALYVLRLPAHDEGLDILGRIAEHAPGTPIAERALMRIAEDRYQQADWEESAEAYDRYVTSFMRGDKAAEAMLKAARAVHESFTGIGHDETPLIEAEQRYREVAREYPMSAQQAGVEGALEQIRAERAAKLLEEGRFYERIDKPRAAVFSYRLLIQTYPDTDAAMQAELALAGLAPYVPEASGASGRPTGRLVAARPDVRPAADYGQDAERNATYTTTAPAGGSP